MLESARHGTHPRHRRLDRHRLGRPPGLPLPHRRDRPRWALRPLARHRLPARQPGRHGRGTRAAAGGRAAAGHRCNRAPARRPLLRVRQPAISGRRAVLHRVRAGPDARLRQLWRNPHRQRRVLLPLRNADRRRGDRPPLLIPRGPMTTLITALLLGSLTLLVLTAAVGVGAMVLSPARVPAALADGTLVVAGGSRTRLRRGLMTGIVAAFVLVALAVLLRAILAGRAPWSNLHEFSMAFAAAL